MDSDDGKKIFVIIALLASIAGGVMWVNYRELEQKARVYEQLTGKKMDPWDMRFIEIRTEVGGE